MILINKLVNKGIINEEDKDLYKYSFNILKGYIFFAIIVILGNLFTKNFKETSLFLLVFFSLRRHCGGFHFDNKITCMIFSIILTLLIPIIINHIFLTHLQIILLQLLISMILMIFPIIEIPQKSLTTIEKIQYKITSIKFLLLLLFVNCICFIHSFYKISAVLLFSLLVTFLSVLVGYFKYMCI